MENVRINQFQSDSIIFPSYSVCTTYCCENVNYGESFLIFVDNKFQYHLVSLKISYENNGGVDLPFNQDEKFFLDEAENQTRINYKLAILEYYKDSNHKFPVDIKEMTELTELDFTLLCFRDKKIKEFSGAIHNKTKNESLKKYLADINHMARISVENI